MGTLISADAPQARDAEQRAMDIVTLESLIRRHPPAFHAGKTCSTRARATLYELFVRLLPVGQLFASAAASRHLLADDQDEPGIGGHDDLVVCGVEAVLRVPRVGAWASSTMNTPSLLNP
ncbi:hypothetical protein ACWEPI_33290 [Streptomyces sp. NPDC004262]